MLKVLLENPGQLVEKQQILEAVWPGTYVGDAVLKDCIRQLREALNDSATDPSYIETSHRRGYRFIGKLIEAASVAYPDLPPHATSVESVQAVDRGWKLPHDASANLTGALGRDSELAKMNAWLDQSLAGHRQTVFVNGEAGIGKTTLIQAFSDRATQVPGLLIAYGQCIEHFGQGEAYLPVLEGLSRLCRSSAGKNILNLLREHAPSWLAHLSLLDAQADKTASYVAGSTRERMLREMGELIERLTQDSPLLLVLEDLHWSDYSTLDLVSYLARRRDPARLMIVGSYRPVDVILAGHPLRNVKRELQAHRLCHELSLEYLSEDAVAQYLSLRFPGKQIPGRLRHNIYRRTDGNPLFMVNLVEYLIDHNVMIEEHGSWNLCVECDEARQGMPASIRELIEKQIERLSPDERSVLESASATGVEFCSVAVAAGLEKPVEWVEEHCDELVRRHRFLSPAGLVELPNGCVSPRYRFHHVLYREVPYSLISNRRRAQMHQRIAERAVAIFGERTNEIAAELAMHFEQSHDWARALQFMTEAARNAAHRSAHHEAGEISRRGLSVLRKLPETPERIQTEATLRMILSVSLLAVQGFVAAEMEQIQSLSTQLLLSQGPSPQVFNMLSLLVLFHKFSGQLTLAEKTAQRLPEIAMALGDQALIMEACRSMGSALVEQGKCAEALEYFDRASALYESNHSHPYTLTIVHDCKVVCECFASRALWFLGDREGALRRMDSALSFARDLSHPGSWMFAAHFAAQLHQLRGEPVLARQQAADVLRMADEYGLDLWQALGNIDMGWAEAELGNRSQGIAQMQRGLSAFMGSGAKLWCPYFLGLLAEQLGKAGRLEEGLITINEAWTVADASGEWFAGVELKRIRDEFYDGRFLKKTSYAHR